MNPSNKDDSESNVYDSVLELTDEDLRTQLADEELKKLACEPGVNNFRRNKLEKDSKKNWDLFYKRNGDRFFKNRYWTKREFRELFREGCSSVDEQRTRYLLEIGCGCGNFVLPLLENIVSSDTASTEYMGGTNQPTDDLSSEQKNISLSSNLYIYCTDISDKAIDILKSNPTFKQHSPDRIRAFTADIAGDIDSISKQLNSNLMDITSLVFVLSSLEPDRMKQALENISLVMKSGGLVLFRDYAIYDKAMLRFSEKSKIADRFYVRQDGTRAYFFTKDQLIEIFESCGFRCQSADYVRNVTFNHATKDKYFRIFLQAKFIKDRPEDVSFK